MEIPLKIIKWNHVNVMVILAIKIQDKKYHALLDTGASLTFIDPAFAKGLGIELVPSGIYVNGLDPYEQEDSLIGLLDVEFNKVIIKTAVFTNDFSFMMGIEKINSLRHKLKMIIGSDFLLRHNAFIDYKREILTLNP